LFTKQAVSFTSDPYVVGEITIAFNPDATMAALGGQNGFELVSVVGGRKGETKWDTKKLATVWGTAAAFSPDNQVVALGLDNGAVYLLNEYTGEKLAQYEIGGRVTGLNYNLDGSLLAAISTSGAKIIQLDSGHISEIGAYHLGMLMTWFSALMVKNC